MIVSRYKARFSQAADPLVQLLVQQRVSPTAITLASLTLIIASCVMLLMTRQVLLFCVLSTLAMLGDVIDGAVARASGRTSKFGAYLDAMCDRYGEAAVVLAVAEVTGYWRLSLIVLAGALLISYAKARAAMEVSVSNIEWPDLMERAERVVMFIVGLAASRLIRWAPLGHDVFWWTLLLLGILIHITVLQRILRVRSFIRTRST